MPSTTSAADEYFWGGYLSFLVYQGFVTFDTPPSEVAAIKAEFIAGLNDSGPLPAESSIVRTGE